MQNIAFALAFHPSPDFSGAGEVLKALCKPKEWIDVGIAVDGDGGGVVGLEELWNGQDVFWQLVVLFFVDARRARVQSRQKRCKARAGPAGGGVMVQKKNRIFGQIIKMGRGVVRVAISPKMIRAESINDDQQYRWRSAAWG